VTVTCAPPPLSIFLCHTQIFAGDSRNKSLTVTLLMQSLVCRLKMGPGFRIQIGGSSCNIRAGRGVILCRERAVQYRRPLFTSFWGQWYDLAIIFHVLAWPYHLFEDCFCDTDHFWKVTARNHEEKNTKVDHRVWPRKVHSGSQRTLRLKRRRRRLNMHVHVPWKRTSNSERKFSLVCIESQQHRIPQWYVHACNNLKHKLALCTGRSLTLAGTEACVLGFESLGTWFARFDGPSALWSRVWESVTWKLEKTKSGGSDNKTAKHI